MGKTNKQQLLIQTKEKFENEVNYFSNTLREHFSQNMYVKYITMFLILVLILLISYCLLHEMKVL